MTEEKPLSEGTEQSPAAETTEPTGSSAANASAHESDGVAAALSALSSAATPEHEESASAQTSQASQTPTPPPAPQDAEAYPAPVGTPIAVPTPAAAAPAAPAASGTVAPAPPAKRKKWPWILAICIVAGVLLIGSITACASTMMNIAFHAIQHNERHYDYDDLFNHDAQDGLWNYYYGGGNATFDDLLEIFDIDEGEMTSNGVYARGIYRVGGANGIAPGLYYLEGSQDGVSNYYVFDGDNEANGIRYEIEASVEYFGNYYTELDEGDAIVFVPFSESSTMHIALKPMDVTPPYQSGCYRVGIDIPAGTYTITCDAEAARTTDSEAGAYVMDDLDFDEDSITESVYVIKGGRQTITVENGEYLELFAAVATPATASTKVPLQHAESEHHHVA